MELTNKVALITGSAKRVGKALALALAQEDCAIVVHYGHSAEAARQTVAEIKTLGGQAWAIAADLDDEAAVNRLIPATLEQAGRLDILINSASIFPPGGPPYEMDAVFLFVDTDEGASGCFGPIGISEARIIAHAFTPLLIGENPHAVERIWDKMYRHAIHGRKGETMMALSKVDLALWDLKGKLLGVPVYQLLGGPSRDRIRAYASMLGHSIAPTVRITGLDGIRNHFLNMLRWN